MPQDPKPYLDKAKALFNQGDYRGAIVYWAQASTAPSSFLRGQHLPDPP